MGTAKTRASNFEVLRIFSMALIILNHICQHGIWFEPNAAISANLCISHSLLGWTGIVGNWLFIMVSGYFVSKSEFSWKRVFKIWFEVFFYSVVIGLSLYLTKTAVVGFNGDELYYEVGFFEAAKPMGTMDLIRSFMPVLFGNNWFASTYILFYCFIPFLNESLKALDEKKHRNLIILMAVSGTIIYMIYGQGFFKEGNLFYFILGYYVASYIRLYNPKFLQNKKTDLLWASALIIFFIAWVLLIMFSKDQVPFISNNFAQVSVYPFASMARFPSLLAAIFLFGIFRNLKMENRQWVNTLASTAFGVYLIHENLLLNKVIWHRLFCFDSFVDSPFLIVYVAFVIIVTFLICAGIDLLRQRFIEKPVMNMLFSKRQAENRAQ